MTNPSKTADIQRIAEEGQRIYDSIRSKYEPCYDGKFLAIDTESKDTYLADDAALAVEAAREEHPNKVFYLIKIGYETAETVARSLAHV